MLVIDKDDFRQTRWYELPAHFHFHFGNAWEAPDGTLHFDYCRAADPTLMTKTLRYVMRGEARPGARPSTTQVRIDPASRRAHTNAFSEVTEFPRVDPRVVGQPHRYLYSMLATATPSAQSFGFHAIARRDLHTGTLEVFDYGPQTLVEEHLLVPRPGSTAEGDGWLVGTVLDLKAQVTRLGVFDAMHLADGPVVTASLPYALPLGFHGAFARS